MIYFLRFNIMVLLFVFSQSAQGGVIFSMAFDQANYDVSPNGMVEVKVFLRQTGIPDLGEFNVLGGAGAVGMTGTGVRVLFGADANDAQVVSVGDITGNSDFDNFFGDPFIQLDTGSALLSQSTLGPPVLGSGAPNTYELLLGTFKFTAAAVAGQVTNISASIPLVPNSSDNIAATDPLPTVLSDIVSAGATITVLSGGIAPVPEPSSLFVWILSVGVGVSLNSRRRSARHA